jgi:DNA-binding transcriptional LysR family regulator
MRRRADALMSEKKMSPRVLFSVDQLSTSCAFTKAQTGISFLTDTLFRRNCYPDEAVLYRLAGTQTRRQYSLFQKHGKLQSGAMRAFCACATEYASKH